MIKKCQNEIFNGLSDLENGKEVNKEIVKERTDALIDVYHILNNEVSIRQKFCNVYINI